MSGLLYAESALSEGCVVAVICTPLLLFCCGLQRRYDDANIYLKSGYGTCIEKIWKSGFLTRDFFVLDLDFSIISFVLFISVLPGYPRKPLLLWSIWTAYVAILTISIPASTLGM